MNCQPTLIKPLIGQATDRFPAWPRTKSFLTICRRLYGNPYFHLSARPVSPWKTGIWPCPREACSSLPRLDLSYPPDLNHLNPLPALSLIQAKSKPGGGGTPRLSSGANYAPWTMPLGAGRSRNGRIIDTPPYVIQSRYDRCDL